MKGRPITREEFERMLTVSEKVRPDDFRHWKGFLEGLWLSGLRLGEALALSWEHDAGFGVEASGKYPCFEFLPSRKRDSKIEDCRCPQILLIG